MPSFLGIDVAKKSLSTHLVIDGVGKPKSFTNNRAGFSKLICWLAKRDVTDLRVCMEATSTYHRGVATALYEAGYTVHVANPWSVKQFAKALLKRGKTDKIDAEVIARYSEANINQHPWAPLCQERQALVQLVRHRERLKKQSTALQNELDIEEHEAVRASLERQQVFVREEIDVTKRAIRAHLGAHRDLKEHDANLRSIPGIGEETSSLILAELGRFERFSDQRQVAAYAGLTPAARQSGSSVDGEARLCRLGNMRLRNGLYLPAVVVFRTRKLFGSLISRLLDEGRSKMTIIVAIMRKLLCLAYGVLRSGKPYDPEWEARRHERAQEPGHEPGLVAGEAESEGGMLRGSGETEAGSAEEQPAKGQPDGAHQPVNVGDGSGLQMLGLSPVAHTITGR